MSGLINKIKSKINEKKGGGGAQAEMQKEPAQQEQQPPQAQQQLGGNNGNSVLNFGADPNGSKDSLKAFQDAINTNDETLVPQGTYLINGDLLLKGDKTLKGDGNRPLLTKSQTGAIILSGTGNVLDNLNIDGRGQMHSGIVILGSGNQVKDCTVAGHGAHGICLDGQGSDSHHNCIKRNFITSNKAIGIAQNKSHSNNIIQNDINNHKDHAITAVNGSHGCLLKENVINKNGQGNNGQAQIDSGSLQGADLGRIKGFNIMDTQVDASGRQDGLQKFQDALNQHGTVVVPSGTYLLNGNLIFRQGQKLIGYGTGNCKPKIIRTQEGTFVFEGDNNLVDNFDLDGQNTMASGVTILGANNTLTNCNLWGHKGHGVCLDGQAPGARSHDNTILNNISHHNGAVGIAQNKSVNNKISFNVLFENGVEGLTIDNQSHGCIASFNTIYANNNGVGGVGVDMVRDCQVCNNQIYDTKLQLAGIKLQNNLGPTDNNQFHNNEIFNCRGFAIHLSNNENRCCSQNSVQGNSIWNCQKGNYGMIQIDHGCNQNTCDQNNQR